MTTTLITDAASRGFRILANRGDDTGPAAVQSAFVDLLAWCAMNGDPFAVRLSGALAEYNEIEVIKRHGWQLYGTLRCNRRVRK